MERCYLWPTESEVCLRLGNTEQMIPFVSADFEDDEDIESEAEVLELGVYLFAESILPPPKQR